jgi:hypothetical protein
MPWTFRLDHILVKHQLDKDADDDGINFSVTVGTDVVNLVGFVDSPVKTGETIDLSTVTAFQVDKTVMPSNAELGSYDR